MGETGGLGSGGVSGGKYEMYGLCTLYLPGTGWHCNPSTIFYNTRINTENGRSNKQLPIKSEHHLPNNK